MKKIIKSKKIKYLVFTMLGIIIGSSIGITANYLLKAEDVEYVDKDNNSTTVQNAITDLYNKAKNGSNEDLIIGEINKTHNFISIPYTGIYPVIYCVYGTSINYGSVGVIKNNACEMKNLSPNTSYNYKIVATDNAGKIYEWHGTIETENVPEAEYYSNPTAVYFNPVTNTKCNSSDYSEANSVTGVSEGCMKWYPYKLENGTNYYLLLDHNVTKGSYYNFANDNSEMGIRSKEQIIAETEETAYINEIGYDLEQLTSRSENPWDSSLRPTLITGEDIKAITNRTAWHPGSGGYSLNGNVKSGQEKGSNIYKWLFNYTDECETYGCDKQDSTTRGYLTATPDSRDSKNVYCITGYAESINVYPANFLYSYSGKGMGLRPVIIVPSSKLS